MSSLITLLSHKINLKDNTKTTTTRKTIQNRYKAKFFPNIEQQHQGHRSDGASQHESLIYHKFFQKKTVTTTKTTIQKKCKVCFFSSDTKHQHKGHRGDVAKHLGSLFFYKRRTKRTTQEQKQQGQYRRDLKHASSLTKKNSNIMDLGVMVPSNMVLSFATKKTTRRTKQENNNKDNTEEV